MDASHLGSGEFGTLLRRCRPQNGAVEKAISGDAGRNGCGGLRKGKTLGVSYMELRSKEAWRLGLRWFDTGWEILSSSWDVCRYIGTLGEN